MSVVSARRVSELRESLEDMSSYKEKELASALEKAKSEITADLDRQTKELKQKLEQNYQTWVETYLSFQIGEFIDQYLVTYTSAYCLCKVLMLSAVCI